MKLLKPSVEILDNSNPYKLIEKCGRVCYKSESRITNDSYVKFINMIKKISTLVYQNMVLFILLFLVGV